MTSERQLSPTEKFLGFKRAYETFSTHTAAGNVVAAFVVGFSIFENRVGACFALAKTRAGHARGEDFVPLAKQIRFLSSQSLLSAVEAEAWLAAARERNRIVHAAMWHVDAFELAPAHNAVKLARQAEKLRQRLVCLNRAE